ncbi:transposase [Kitasatospora sp. NPDC093558]|uniref:transposase n=1 Tax=Kitasatospora sp. NPDC093558 TaxID=3155201 RepID=UPI0034126406
MARRGPKRRLDLEAEYWRQRLAAIVVVATPGCTWRQLPPVFEACWQTVHQRFAKWKSGPGLAGPGWIGLSRTS